MSSHWLFPEERREVVSSLLQLNLLKLSAERNLPLKGGGYTDIYINLRDARNNPEAIRYLAGIYAFALDRRGVDRFVEVPNSVSCIAGPLAVCTNIPYITIREEKKEGRVGDAEVIGSCVRGERAVILDDVITDGASKIVPFRKCQSLGLHVDEIVVLVDRQRGWQEVFEREGIPCGVYSGMTLHDMRKVLIQDLRAMERCERGVEEKNPLVIALDGLGWDEILPLVDSLRGAGCILKVGDLLVEKGVSVVSDLSVYGRVMVDLKSHDIPNTVGNICSRLAPYNPWAVTVHASGGVEMVRAARKHLGKGTKLLAVTLLTSLDKSGAMEVYRRTPPNQVKQLANIAWRSGADGFVCSGEEVATLRSLYPEAVLLVPGVRSGAFVGDDQRRVTFSPGEILSQGADYFVVGRRILLAEDLVEEAHRILREEVPAGWMPAKRSRL